MKVNVLAAGSRGDVQPMVALGVGLTRAGHEVTICAVDDFEDLVTGHGLRFVPAGLRIEELRLLEHSIDFARWLERTGCAGETAAEAEVLLGDRVADGRLTLDKIAIRALEGR